MKLIEVWRVKGRFFYDLPSVATELFVKNNHVHLAEISDDQFATLQNNGLSRDGMVCKWEAEKLLMQLWEDAEQRLQGWKEPGP